MILKKSRNYAPHSVDGEWLTERNDEPFGYSIPANQILYHEHQIVYAQNIASTIV